MFVLQVLNISLYNFLETIPVSGDLVLDHIEIKLLEADVSLNLLDADVSINLMDADVTIKLLEAASYH